MKAIVGFFVGAGLCMMMFGCELIDPGDEPDNALTMREVYEYPITDLIGERITLRTKVTWTSEVPIPVDGGSEDSDTTVAHDLRIWFEEGEHFVREDLRGQRRADIPIESSLVAKHLGGDLIEYYTIDGVRIDSSQSYYVDGRFEYRISFPEEQLNNPEFIREKNSPTYWHQSFKYVLTDIDEVDE